jgi:hypothetical protein
MKEMAQKEVLDYIAKCLNAGKDEKFIKGALINAGHDKVSVDKAYNYVVKGSSEAIQSKKIPLMARPHFELRTTVLKNESPLIKPKTKENSNDETSNKKLLFTLMGAFLGIVLIVAIVVLVSKAEISESDLNEGVTFSLAEGGVKNFNLKGEEHSIEVNSVYSDYAEFTIRSTPITINLEIGEKKILNLDEDDYYDLEIELKDIENFVPVIFLKKTIERMCRENWMCEGWTECSEFGVQTRLCEDFNNCGTFKDMPELSKTCIYEGELCIEDWNCTSWTICSNGTQTRECTDNNNCGTLISKPLEEQNCTAPEHINCGEVTNSMNDCFINASEGCSLATSKVSYLNVLDPGTGNYLLNYTQIISIEGMNNTNCSYSIKYDYYSQSFSEEYIQELLLGGSTMEKIEKEEKDVNESVQSILNDTSYCLINQEGLTEMFKTIQEIGVPSNPFECFDLEFISGNPSYTYSLCGYNGVNATSYCWTY